MRRPCAACLILRIAGCIATRRFHYILRVQCGKVTGTFSALSVDGSPLAAPCVTVWNEAACCRLHLQHLSLADRPVLGGLSMGKPRERGRAAAALP